jgi:hypothetical protein
MITRGATQLPTPEDTLLVQSIFATDALPIKEPYLKIIWNSPQSVPLLKSCGLDGFSSDQISPWYDDKTLLGFVIESSTLPLITTWAAPWNDDLLHRRLAKLSALKKRAYILPALGFAQGKWHDGPLLHVHHTGDFCSFLPSGGPASLSLRLKPQKTAPASLEQVCKLEALSPQKTLRCLLAATFAKAAKTPYVTTEDYSQATAISLVLLRMAMPKNELLFLAKKEAALPAAWRRLLQHLGIAVSSSPQENIICQKIESLMPLLPTDPVQLMSLGAWINRAGPLIPETLLR